MLHAGVPVDPLLAVPASAVPVPVVPAAIVPIAAVSELPWMPFKSKHPFWQVPGGHIVFHLGRLDAHCGFEGTHKNKINPCRLGRTCTEAPSRRGAQGRPLGFLLAWLNVAHKYGDDKRHKNGTKAAQMCVADYDNLSFEVRNKWRMWLNEQTSQEFVDLREKERDARIGESSEPAELLTS